MAATGGDGFNVTGIEEVIVDEASKLPGKSLT